MPKISNYKDLTSNITKNSDPKTWGWDYPIKIKNIGQYVLGVNTSPDNKGDIIYGIFKPSDKKTILDIKDLISALEIREIPGVMIAIPEIKKVAVEKFVATDPEYRGKGLARLLYDYVLDTYEVILGDEELFTDPGKESKSLSIWTKYLFNKGKVLNFNTKTKEYTEFNTDSGNNENIRFVVFKDKNILQKIDESFKNWLNKGVSSAMLAGLLSTPTNLETEITPSLPKDKDPVHLNAMRLDYQLKKEKEAYLKQQELLKQNKTIIKPQSNKINVNIISKLESGSDRNAKNKRSGASGLCQLKKPAWEEATKSLYGKNYTKFSYEKYNMNSDMNKKVSDHYYNVIIPKHLNEFEVPISKETILASYNWGSNNVKKMYRKYGNNWIRYAPYETRSYIERYKNIENDVK